MPEVVIGDHRRNVVRQGLRTKLDPLVHVHHNLGRGFSGFANRMTNRKQADYYHQNGGTKKEGYKHKARLEANALSKHLAVIAGIAKHELGALRTLEVKVCWVFPCEANTTVNLNVLSCSMEVGV